MWSTKISIILLPLLYLFMLLLLVLGLLLFLPVLILRQFVSLLGQILGGPSLGKILSASATSHACISGCGTSLVPFILEGIPNLDHIKSEFINKVLNAKDAEGQILYPELKQTVVAWGGYLFWKDLPNFQLPIRVLEPADLVSPAGLEVLRSFYRRDWKMGEGPLWELIVVPGLNDSFGLVFIFDHALCDALSIQKLIDKISHPSICIKRARTETRGSSKLLRLVATIFRVPYDAVLFLRTFRRTALSVSKQPCQNKDSNVNSISDPGLTLVTKTFNLPDLKRIAVAHGVSLNAVLMSSIQGSLQKVWNEGNLLYFPTPHPNHPEKLRNLGGMAYVEHNPLHKSPEERLHEIDDQLRGLKSSTFPLLIGIVGTLSGCLPPFLLRRMLNGASGSLKSFVLSTFIASKHPASLCGYPVAQLGSVGSGHEGTKVVAFFAFSWADLMSFTVMGDQEVMSEKDGKFILESISEEFETLKEVAEKKSADHINIAIQDVKQV